MNEQNDFPSETKIEIISINEKLSIYFIYVPQGYVIKKITLDNHETKVVGRLNQFNRIKILNSWRKDNGDLVKLFTEALLKKEWDFEKYPNPVAYASYYRD